MGNAFVYRPLVSRECVTRANPRSPQPLVWAWWRGPGDLCAHSQHTGRQQRAQEEYHSLTLQLHPISECPARPRCVHAQLSAPLHHQHLVAVPLQALIIHSAALGGVVQHDARRSPDASAASISTSHVRPTPLPKPHLASTKCKPAYATACQKASMARALCP